MAASSSSSSDSSSSRSSSPEPANKQKQALKKTPKSKEEVEDSSSSSGSESDSDESSSDEDSSDMDTSEDAPKAESPAKKIISVTPKAYKPPSGFKSAKQQAPPSSNSSSILSNLNGKQVIHITAPSFLPLSKVKEISMSKISKGHPILSFDGANYGIPAESLREESSQGKSLLLFDPKTQTYCKQADNIPSYHIQELMGVPEADKAAVEALRDTVKPPRPQPKNLKMRFRPVGSLPAPPETLDSDSESEAEPSFKVPSGEKERKRKHHHTDGDAAQVTTLPSRKKSRKHTQENGDEEQEQGQKKVKKSHKDGEEKKRKKSKA
ncbi:hypothetical protein N7466_009131 [Penicillium verhagenii]|uniref:uncharacterized protein n=1 Tax=Penicillium verhagenii TaxID=1562060 RepID=UPI0025454BC4|nr:uncharacterized protein N7466_009131 [Penicillium verhagenii]KAJ5920805.1 hypothetical protein N7466_009131 [Penicillium verhagenii]